MKKRLLSLAVILTLALSLLTTAALAAETPAPWDGSVATAFAGGAGTETDPYQIATAAQMAYFAQCVNSGSDSRFTDMKYVYVKLTADIDLNNQSWTPIGQTHSCGYSAKLRFYGSFDGGNHTIYNLKVTEWEAGTNQGASYASGLFGSTDNRLGGVKIQNLTVENADVSGGHACGVIFGYFHGTMENCHVKNAKVLCENKNSEANGDKAGMLVGYLDAGSTISGCSATNCEISAYRDFGGIAGCATSSTSSVTNCTVTDLRWSYSSTGERNENFGYIVGRESHPANNTGNAYVEAREVAQIGDTTYASLQAALDAAGTGDTVKLLEDVDENVTVKAGKCLTLDLNGKTLNGGTVKSKPALTNYGTVTITDSVGTGAIKREDTRETSTSSYYVILNEGIMTIAGGRIYNQSGLYPEDWAGSSLICNGLKKDAVLTISGGTISQENFIAVKNEEHGTLNITGGTISSKTQAVQNWNTATITGGELTGWVTTWTYYDTQGTMTIGGDAEINGNVELVALTYGGVEPSYLPELEITGGTIDGKILVGAQTNPYDSETFEENTQKGEVTITGGTFTEDIGEFVGSDSLLVWTGSGYQVIQRNKKLELGLLGGLFGGSHSPLDDFSDLSRSAWYADAVEYCVEHDLMSGVGDGKFDPNGSMTRAMVWTVLGRLSGETFNGTGANWYAEAQSWAMANGISDGTNPNGTVTREELVTMLWRLNGCPAADVSLLNNYNDGASVSDWAKTAMAWAVSVQLVEGSNWNLTPSATALRCQVAAIFMRYHRYC